MRNNEVIVDSRGKISLGFRKHVHDRYLWTEDPDGTIHLIPAVLVPARRLQGVDPDKELAWQQ